MLVKNVESSIPIIKEFINRTERVYHMSDRFLNTKNIKEYKL